MVLLRAHGSCLFLLEEIAHETSNVQAVLDGDLDEFIFAYLKEISKK